MKKLIIAIVLLITANLSTQSESFNLIDYDKPYVDIRLQNKIEINGHTFDNELSKNPIRFHATLDGIKIYDSKREYQKRKCEIDKCKTIHLEPKLNGTLLINGWTTTNTSFLLSN